MTSAIFAVLPCPGIDHEGDAWVTIDQPPELRPPSRQPPEGMLLPQVPDRARGWTDLSERRDTREERFSEEVVQVEAFSIAQPSRALLAPIWP